MGDGRDSTQELIPNIITYAAITRSVPIEKTLLSEFSLGDLKLTADLSLPIRKGGWRGLGALEVTEKMWRIHGNTTNGLALMNPGYDVHGGHDMHPPLTKVRDLPKRSARLIKQYLCEGVENELRKPRHVVAADEAVSLTHQSAPR